MLTDKSNREAQPQGNNLPPLHPGYLPYNHGAPADDEIDLRELWNVIWQGRWLLIAVTAVAAIASIVVALSLPNIYRSEALLAPSDESQGGGLSQMAGQLGGLAALAGIEIGGGGSDGKIAVAMAVMKSRRFIADFVARHNILPELMAVDHWDVQANKIVFDPEVYDVAQAEWVRDVSPPKSTKPSDWEAYKAFTEIFSVSQDKETGFVSVAIEHQSPHIAGRWVTLLVEEVNAVVKQHDVEEAERSIEYLQKQLDRIALAEMRTVFYQLIEEQMKTIMLAEVRDEYVFSTIDPAVVPEEKAKPKRALICVLGVILGAMLGVMFVLIRHFASPGSRDEEG